MSERMVLLSLCGPKDSSKTTLIGPILFKFPEIEARIDERTVT